MTSPQELARLQADFARAVLGGDDALPATLLAGDPARAHRRLAIYRRAIVANWCRALRAAYPVVVRIVGEAFFDEAVRQHAGREPPTDGDLNRYGATFAAFLAGYEHALAMPWLPDVARLEWAWHEALMAADAPAFDYRALAGVPEAAQPRLVFCLHPSVRLVRSRWPILSLWEANQPERDGTPQRDEGCDDVLVWREGQEVRLALVAPSEAAMLEALAQGAALAEIARPDADLETWLRRLTEHGMLAGFSVGGAAPVAGDAVG